VQIESVDASEDAGRTPLADGRFLMLSDRLSWPAAEKRQTVAYLNVRPEWGHQPLPRAT